MLRSIIAVFAAFAALNIGVMLLFMAATLGLGIEGALRPGSYWTSDIFNAIVLVGGLALAVGAGALSAWLGRSVTPSVVLAAIMFVIGLAGAVMNASKPDPPPRPGPADGETTPQYTARVLADLSSRGKEPHWFAFGMPITGAAGALLGGRLARPRRPSGAR